MAYGPTTEGLDDVASRLNPLILICKVGASGFGPQPKRFRMTISGDFSKATLNRRAELAAELQLEVKRLARDPVDSGHAASALHRRWMYIKAGVTGKDDAAAISEASGVKLR